MGATIRGEYPADWEAIAKAVKDAAGWKCVRCGHPHVPSIGRTLTVHHLDGHKGNCRWWNLPALCQACHLSIQGRVNLAQAYLHEHTPWFRPYVAGFYAYSVLNEELTPAEVHGRMTELLFAGQPWLEGVAYAG